MSIKRKMVFNAIYRCNAAYIPWQLDVTATIEDILANRYGSDNFLYDCVGCHLAREKNKRHIMLDGMRHRDIFGIEWQRESAGDIGVVIDSLLKEPTLKDYKIPKPEFEMVREKCVLLEKNHPNEFRIFELGFSLFERAWTLRGMENLLTDFLLEPDFVRDLFENLTQYNLAVIETACEYDIDAIMFGDDWASQQGLMMGSELWRMFIKPSMSLMFAAAKDKGKVVILHSCGNIQEIMGDLIEMGLDVYNTFQPEVYDIPKFKREFGRDITIYGGISTQGVLASGTPDEVRETTLRTMDALWEKGGYIVAPTHQIPAGTPLDNILSFIETVQNNVTGVE